MALLGILVLACWGLAAGLSHSSTPSLLPVPPSAGAPSVLVAAAVDARLVVVDTATGRVVRTLVRADPAYELPNSVEVARDGRTVYYDAGGADPAAGFMLHVPVVGGIPAPIPGEVGTCPAVSPDGTRLAVCVVISVDVIDLVSEARSALLTFDDYRTPRWIDWSDDSRFLTIDVDPPASESHHLIVVDATDGTIVRSITSPVALLLAGAGQTRVPGPVRDLDADATGKHLLVVTDDDELWWISGEQAKFLGDGWVSAAW